MKKGYFIYYAEELMGFVSDFTLGVRPTGPPTWVISPARIQKGIYIMVIKSLVAEENTQRQIDATVSNTEKS
jgi:hypothetical protein